MDEILVANFMLFQEVVEDSRYDLVDRRRGLGRRPLLARASRAETRALAWFTDFVGYLPMPEGGDREARLTADYNAEMIGHIERYPRIRDASIFVGNPDDIVPAPSAPACPRSAPGPRRISFQRLLIGLASRRVRRSRSAPREARLCERRKGLHRGRRRLRRRLPLLRRIIAAFPRRAVTFPDLRMIVVAGPRIDAESLPRREGVEVRGYVPDLRALRRLRPRLRTGRPHHLHGAGRGAEAVPLFSARTISSRISTSPSPGKLSRRASHGLRLRLA